MEDQRVKREKSLFWSLCRDAAWPIEVKGMNEAIHWVKWKSSCWALNEGGPICTTQAGTNRWPRILPRKSPQQQAGVHIVTRHFNQCLTASSTRQIFPPYWKNSPWNQLWGTVWGEALTSPLFLRSTCWSVFNLKRALSAASSAYHCVLM